MCMEDQMGFWGPGLFESDYSRDALNDILAPWIDDIERLSGSKRATVWDEVDPDELAIKMKVLLVLRRAKFPIESFRNRRSSKRTGSHSNKAGERTRATMNYSSNDSGQF